MYLPAEEEDEPDTDVVDTGDSCSMFRSRERASEAHSIYNNVDVVNKAFEGDWSAIQRGAYVHVCVHVLRYSSFKQFAE